MTTPRMVTVPCVVNNAPRHDAGEHSLWYTGAVEEFIPLPMPVTIRPVMSCATVSDDARMIVPTTMIDPPAMSIDRRPYRSPIK